MKHKTDVSNLKRRLVEGIQVITGEGVLSGSGHLSARIPGTETFLINPRFAGVLAEAKDICTVKFDGKRIAGKGPIPSESPIHAAVYKARPDANRGRSNARLENPYRAWPFLLYKHKVKSKAQIRAGIRTLKEGEHY